MQVSLESDIIPPASAGSAKRSRPAPLTAERALISTPDTPAQWLVNKAYAARGLLQLALCKQDLSSPSVTGSSDNYVHTLPYRMTPSSPGHVLLPQNTGRSMGLSAHPALRMAPISPASRPSCSKRATSLGASKPDTRTASSRRSAATCSPRACDFRVRSRFLRSAGHAHCQMLLTVFPDLHIAPYPLIFSSSMLQRATS